MDPSGNEERQDAEQQRKSHGDGEPRARLADVAEHAGVSASTVSRVVNNTAPVSGHTRARVEEAIKELGYTGTASRHGGERAPLRAVAMVVTDILNPYYAEIVRGVEEEIEVEGLSLLLYNTTEDAEREERTLNRLLTLDLEGVIVFGSRLPSERLFAFQEQLKIPVVVINRRMARAMLACVTVDSAQATYRAAAYLLNLGHTHIAHIAGPPTSASAEARRRGVERALAEAGHPLRPDWCSAGFPDSEGGFQAMTSLLATSERPPTAVLVYNDVMALGALHAIRNAGLRVPEDISVIGFDDIAVAAHINPPLTTIAQPKYRMGRLAVQLLRRLRRRDPVPGEGYVLLESPLVIRESSGPAPGARTAGARNSEAGTR